MPCAARFVLLQRYWQRMPEDGPDPPLEPGPVDDLVYDCAQQSASDAEDE